MVQSSGRRTGSASVVIPTEHIPARAGFTAIAALAFGLGLSGCFGGGAGEKAAVQFVRGPAEKALAQYSKVSLAPAAERFSARSVLLDAPRSAAVIAVPTEAEAARAIRASPPLVDTAHSSAAKVDQIVSETTSDGAAQTRIKACFKGSTTTGAIKVAFDYR